MTCLHTWDVNIYRYQSLYSNKLTRFFSTWSNAEEIYVVDHKLQGLMTDKARVEDPTDEEMLGIINLYLNKGIK